MKENATHLWPNAILGGCDKDPVSTKAPVHRAARLIREAAQRKPHRMNDERAHAWIMRAKGGYKLGVPFGIVAPYALLCGLQKLWHVASEKLITPPTVLRL